VSGTDDRTSERWRAALRCAVLAVLILSALPFGSVQPWAVLVLELAAAGLGLGALALLWVERAGPRRPTPSPLIPALVLLAIALVQLVPLPGSWAHGVAEPTQRARIDVGIAVPELAAAAAPLSLEPPATVDGLLRLLAYVLVGLAAAVALRTPAHLRQAALAIVLAGTFQALYGAAEYLSGHQHIFWYAKRAYADEASGTFINRNHFAGYLAMTLPFCLLLALGPPRRAAAGRSWRDRALALTQPSRLVSLGGALAAAVVWAGVILSYSRGGLAVALVVTGIVAWQAKAGDRRRWIVLATLLGPALWLMWQEVKAPGARFVADGQEITSLSGRTPVWRSSLDILRDYPLLGSGIGTFEDAFILYRPSAVRLRWDHAHNDWLQVGTEAGLVGLGAALWLVLATLRRARGPSRPAADGRPYHACIGAAVTGAALHAVVDFGLRIPAIAVLAAVLAGMSWIVGSWTSRPAPGVIPLDGRG